MRHRRLLSFMLVCSACLAQDTGAIAGKIVDEFGEPVSGAIVIARNSAGQEFKTTAGASGEYTLDKVAPGAYQINITMVAMKKFDKKDFIVEAAKTAKFDVTLLQHDGYLGTLGEEDRFSAAFFDMIGSKPVPTGSMPRLPDGKPDLSGFWWADKPAGQPEPVQPRPWADAIRKERQTSNMRDLPSARCLPISIIHLAGGGNLSTPPRFSRC